MDYVQSFKELEVYALAKRLSNEIFSMTKTFPKAETYSLIDQIRRSSRSVGAQIAEGWGKRRYEKHFISKLTDADAEQLETQHWLGIALDCEYVSKESIETLTKDYERLGKMLGAMITKSSTFCKKPH